MLLFRQAIGIELNKILCTGYWNLNKWREERREFKWTRGLLQEVLLEKGEAER
jgi:hypothetical protein